MQLLFKNLSGILFCFFLALPAWLLGTHYPIIGAPVFAILIGLLLIFCFPSLTAATTPFSQKYPLGSGIKYTAKKILQLSIIFLGFNMNLLQVFQVGSESLAIILSTLTASFLTAYFVGKALKIDWQTTTLIGVGTSICGAQQLQQQLPLFTLKIKI